MKIYSSSILTRFWSTSRSIMTMGRLRFHAFINTCPKWVSSALIPKWKLVYSGILLRQTLRSTWTPFCWCARTLWSPCASLPSRHSSPSPNSRLRALETPQTWIVIFKYRFSTVCKDWGKRLNLNGSAWRASRSRSTNYTRKHKTEISTK